MTKKSKIVEQIKNNPRDAKFNEVRKVLKEAGFWERQPKSGSSHYVYYHESLDRIDTLTKGAKRLPEYQVKDALRALQRLENEYEKNKKYYMSLSYPIQIEEVDEGFCAFIPELKGCKAFGETVEIALRELESVKEGFFDVFLEMGKPILEPVIHLDIPYGIFRKMKHREDLEAFVVY